VVAGFFLRALRTMYPYDPFVYQTHRITRGSSHCCFRRSRNVGILNSAEFYRKALMAVKRIDRPGFACSKPIPKLRFASWPMRNNRSRQCLLSLFVSMFLCTASFSMALSDL
jgi:hypothetical protein